MGATASGSYDPTTSPPVPAEVLWRDYYYWRSHTSIFRQALRRHPVAPPKLTPASLRPFERLSSWCAERGLNGREWLFSVFAARRWMYYPKPAQLQSEKVLKDVRAGKAWWPTDLYRQRVLEEAGKTDCQRQFDPNVDLLPAVEEAKRYHLRGGQGFLECMEAMSVETFGWHPRSTVCARCPGQAACRAKLEAEFPAALDVRLGKATPEQARARAILRGANDQQWSRTTGR